MTDYTKPVVVPSEDSGPFWAAAKGHKLSLQKCGTCGSFRFPPSPLCPECTAMGGEWTELSGRGKVSSFVVFHRAYHKSFEGDLPYAVALIELDEGVRLMSTVVGGDPWSVSVGDRVVVGWEPLSDGRQLYVFESDGAG